MKVALCFYGLVGSKTDKNGNGVPLDPSIAYKLNYENLIADNDVDVFIHSWSDDFKDELERLYKPKKSVIEKQKEFPYSDKIRNNRDFRERLKTYLTRLKSPKSFKLLSQQHKTEAFRAFSRWYSNKTVLNLKSQYERENNFKYDCVMVMRLDVGFYSKLNFEEYDMSLFYASNWNDYPTKFNNFTCNQKNHNQGKGFLDFWFFSNSENMDSFSTLYDDIGKYHVSPHRSSFQHVSTFTDKIEYIKYRWLDFEMIRRKEFKAEN